MHDTSTESISRWKAVGARRNQSTILGPTLNLQPKRQSRKYRPSKQKQLSNSKIFNRNRSRIDSLDNIPKQDLNDSTIKDPSGPRTKRLTKNSEEANFPIVRVSSESTLMGNKDLSTFQGVKQRRISSFGTEKELITLKQDYNRFKQKILNQLETQKQNIQNIVNEILLTVRNQLLAIEQKYSKISNSKGDQSIQPMSVPVVSGISIPKISTFISTSPTKLMFGQVSPIGSGLNHGTLERTPSQKAIINQLSSLASQENDPITQRFSKFYSAIEKLKSDLDCLHEISTVNQQVNQQGSSKASFSSRLNGMHSRKGLSFLKT